MRKLLTLGAMLCALSPAFAQDTGKPLATPGPIVEGKAGMHRSDAGTAEWDSRLSPLPIRAPYANPAAWAGGSFDARAFGSVTIAVTVAPTTAYNVQWSPDGIAGWTTLTCIDLSFNASSSIATSFTGAMSCQGGGYIRLNGGAAGTFLIGASN